MKPSEMAYHYQRPLIGNFKKSYASGTLGKMNLTFTYDLDVRNSQNVSQIYVTTKRKAMC